MTNEMDPKGCDVFVTDARRPTHCHQCGHPKERHTPIRPKARDLQTGELIIELRDSLSQARQERDSAVVAAGVMRESIYELAGALEAMRPFPMILDGVVAGFIARAKSALSLDTTLPARAGREDEVREECAQIADDYADVMTADGRLERPAFDIAERIRATKATP